MSGTSDALSLIGRIFLAVIFVVSGFGKIGGFEGLVGQIASKGFPAAQVFAVGDDRDRGRRRFDADSRLEGAVGRISAGRVYRHRDRFSFTTSGPCPKRRK